MKLWVLESGILAAEVRLRHADGVGSYVSFPLRFIESQVGRSKALLNPISIRS